MRIGKEVALYGMSVLDIGVRKKKAKKAKNARFWLKDTASSRQGSFNFSIAAFASNQPRVVVEVQ